MHLQLIWQNDAQPQTYSIAGEQPVIIGRRQDCDIVLADKSVSRRHAEVVTEGGRLHLHNLSQTHVIAISSRREVGPGETALLSNITALQLGLEQLRMQSLQTLAGTPIMTLAVGRLRYCLTPDKTIIIGRLKECDVTLDNYTVSRQHAGIFAQQGRFYVCNLSHTRPIYIFTKYNLSQGQKTPLKSGYSFNVGLVQIQAQSQELANDDKLSAIKSCAEQSLISQFPNSLMLPS